MVLNFTLSAIGGREAAAHDGSLRNGSDNHEISDEITFFSALCAPATNAVTKPPTLYETPKLPAGFALN